MKYIADLHIHSRYSRATSPDLNIAGLYCGAKIKGIDIIGTGDFTFPAYVKEMEENLEPMGGGLYRFRGDDAVNQDAKCRVSTKDDHEPLFLITTEIANIYKRGGKARRVHTCVWAPGLAEVKELNKQLAKVGNIMADGRPILGMDVADMAKLIWSVSPDFIIIPAHAWTPWFAIFGSKSGFDSIEECFGDLTPNIYAIETGLSSDPAMNWRLSQLDDICLVSNSDAHSLPNLGREATVFELGNLSIQSIKQGLQKKDRHTEPRIKYGAGLVSASQNQIPKQVRDDDVKNKVAYTIEFYPQEGKYHWDGHLTCKVSMAPAETKKHKGICPKCKKPLTLGVEYRVEELADRTESKKNGDYKYIVPLQEIIADALDQGKQSKRVQAIYDRLIAEFGNEFAILLDVPVAALAAAGLPEISEGIRRVRAGELYIEPGFDGQYGVVKVFKAHERAAARKRQEALF